MSDPPGPSPVGPGTRLGHYEVVSVLGAGGMGVVYRAQDTQLRREVAIKVLPQEWSDDGWLALLYSLRP